ncbi:MAG: putative Ig domain-containing protein [Opitutus sp.]|nr:putative Ig domain-containing protein [Opitutus sp.]
MKRVSVGLALCVLLVTLATLRRGEPSELPQEEGRLHEQQSAATSPTPESTDRDEEKHSSAKTAIGGVKSALSSETALAKDLRTLDIATRERVFAAIARREIPEQDYQSLRVTASGQLYYVCRIPKLDAVRGGEPHNVRAVAASAATTDTGSKTSRGAVPISKPPLYHSRPGAKNVLYLNFSGATLKKTGWNEIAGVKTLTAIAFSLDADIKNFSDAEQKAIHSVWERVAEDFSPFDIDVTTEAPKKITKRTAQVLITSSVMTNGASMPLSDDAAGLSFLDTFGESGAPAYYTPALVFHDQVNSLAEHITEAVSHEAGHLFGLSHDGTIYKEYYAGHAAGMSWWAPIMGVGYYGDRTQWSQGEYYQANNFQDDLAIIAAHTGWAKDEAGNGANTANIKAAKADGKMEVKGVLSTEDDSDWYAFSTGKTRVTFTASPHIGSDWARWANGDVRLELLDRNGKVLAKDDPTDSTDATLIRSVEAGMYFIRVSSSGTGTPLAYPPSGYTPYGSVGQYRLSSNILSGAPAIVGSDKVSVGVLNKVTYKLRLTNRAQKVTVSGLPKWLKYNAKTGTFTGTPKATGTFVVTVRATNSHGTANLPLTFIVHQASPVISSQSKGLLRTKKGATLKLSVSAKSANGAISYQWKRNGVPISGAKSKTLKLSKAKLSDSGFYSVDMRNKIGTTTSALMYVRVMPKRTQAVLWDGNAKFLKGLESYSDVADIAIHFNQGVAVRAKGSLVFFRENKQSTQRPEKVPTSVAKVVAHEGRFAAIKTDGTVTFWHLPNTGEWPTPPSLKRVVDVALGASHGLALHENGTVTAWGIAGSKAAKVPKKAKNVRAITATRNASFALLSTGKVIGWGDGYGAPWCRVA